MKSDWKRFTLEFGGPARASLEVWLRGAGVEVPEAFTDDNLRGRSPSEPPNSFLHLLGRSYRLHLPTLELRCLATFTPADEVTGRARILTGTVSLNMEGLECSSAVRGQIWPDSADEPEPVKLVFGHGAWQLKTGLDGKIAAYLFLGEARGQVWQMIDCGDISPDSQLTEQLEKLSEELIGRPIGLKTGSAGSAKVFVQVEGGVRTTIYSPDVIVLLPGPEGTRSEWLPRTLTFDKKSWEFLDEDRVAGLLDATVKNVAGAVSPPCVIEWGDDQQAVLRQFPPVYPVSTNGGAIQGEGWLWTWARLGQNSPTWLRLRLESNERLPVALDALTRNPRLSAPISFPLGGGFSASLDGARTDSVWCLRIDKLDSGGKIRLEAGQAQAQVDGPELPFYHDPLGEAAALPGDLLQGWQSYFERGIPPRSVRLFCRGDGEAISLESVTAILVEGEAVRLVTRFGSYLGWLLTYPSRPTYDENLSGPGPVQQIVRVGEVDFWIDFAGTLLKKGKQLALGARAIVRALAGGVEHVAAIVGTDLWISTATDSEPMILAIGGEGEARLASPADDLLLVLALQGNTLTAQRVVYDDGTWTLDEETLTTPLTISDPAWVGFPQAIRARTHDWVIAQLSPTALFVWQLEEQADQLSLIPDAWSVQGDDLWVAASGTLWRRPVFGERLERGLSFEHPATALAVVGNVAVIGSTDGVAHVYELDGRPLSLLSGLLPGSGARTRLIALQGGREFAVLSDGEGLTAWQASARAGLDLRGLAASNVKRGSREPGHGLAEVRVLGGVLKRAGTPAIALLEGPSLHQPAPQTGQILALAPWIEWSPWDSTEFRAFHRNLVLEVDELNASWPPDGTPGRPGASAARRAVRDRHALAGELQMNQWVDVQNWLPATSLRAEAMLSTSAEGLLHLLLKVGQQSWDLEIRRSDSILSLSGLELDATGDVKVINGGRHKAQDSSVEPLLSNTHVLDNLSILRALSWPALDAGLRLEPYVDRKEAGQHGLLSGIKTLCSDVTLYCRQLRLLDNKLIRAEASAGFAGEFGVFGSSGWPRIGSQVFLIASLQTVDLVAQRFHMRAALPNPFRPGPESDDAARGILTSSQMFELVVQNGVSLGFTDSGAGFSWNFPGQPEFSVVGLRGRVDKPANGPFQLSEMTVQIYAFGIITEHVVAGVVLEGKVNSKGLLEYSDGQGTRVGPSEACFDREFVLGSVGGRKLTLRPFQGGTRAVLRLGSTGLTQARKSGFQYAFLVGQERGFAVLWAEPGFGLAGVISEPLPEQRVNRALIFDGIQYQLSGKRLAWQVSYLGLSEHGRDWVTSEYWTAFLADPNLRICLLYGDLTNGDFGGAAILAWGGHDAAPIHSNVALVELKESADETLLTLMPGQSWYVETRQVADPQDIPIRTELWYGSQMIGLAALAEEPKEGGFVTYQDNKLVKLAGTRVPFDPCIDQSVIREPELEPTGTPYMAHRSGSASRRMRLGSSELPLWTPTSPQATEPAEHSGYRLYRLLVRAEGTGLNAVGPPAFVQHPQPITLVRDLLDDGTWIIELEVPQSLTLLRIETQDWPHLLETVQVFSNGELLFSDQKILGEHGYDLQIPPAANPTPLRRIVIKARSSVPTRIVVSPPAPLTESLLLLHGTGAESDQPLLSVLNVTSPVGNAMEPERIEAFLRSIAADGLVFRRQKLGGEPDRFEVAATADRFGLLGFGESLAPTMKSGYQELDPLLVLPGAASRRRLGTSHYRLDRPEAAFVDAGRRMLLKLDGQTTPQEHTQGYGLQIVETIAFEAPRPLAPPGDPQTNEAPQPAQRFLPQELELTLGVSKPGAMMIHKVEAYQEHGGQLGRALDLAWREPQRLILPSPSSVSWTEAAIQVPADAGPGNLHRLVLGWLERVSVDLGKLRPNPLVAPPTHDDYAFGLASWVQERLLNLDASQRFPIEFGKLASQAQTLPVFLVTRLRSLRDPVDDCYPLVTLWQEDELLEELALSEVFGDPDSTSLPSVLIHPIFSNVSKSRQATCSASSGYLLAACRSRTLFLWTGAASGPLNLTKVCFEWPIRIVASRPDRVLVVLQLGNAHAFQIVNPDGTLADRSMPQTTPTPLDAALGSGDFVAFLTSSSVETLSPNRSVSHELVRPRLGIHPGRSNTAFAWGRLDFDPALRLLIVAASPRTVIVEGGLLWAASTTSSGFACLARDSAGNLTVHTVTGDQEPLFLALLSSPVEKPTAFYYAEAEEGKPRKEGAVVAVGGSRGELAIWRLNASSTFVKVEEWQLSTQIIRIASSPSGWIAICEDGRAFEFSEGGKKLTDLVNLLFPRPNWAGRDLQFEWARAPGLLLADSRDVLGLVTATCRVDGTILEIGFVKTFEFRQLLLTCSDFVLEAIDFSVANDGWKRIASPYRVNQAGLRKTIPNPVTTPTEWQELGGFLRLRLTFQAPVHLSGCWLETSAVYAQPKRVALLEPSEVGSKVALILKGDEEESTLAFGGSALNAGKLETEGTVNADSVTFSVKAAGLEEVAVWKTRDELLEHAVWVAKYFSEGQTLAEREELS